MSGTSPEPAAGGGRPDGGAPQRAALADELVLVARVLCDTLAGSHLDATLERLTGAAPGLPAASVRAVRDMAYGTMRRYGLLRWVAGRLNSKRPLPLLGALQVAGLAQLLDGRRAPAVVIDQAVAAAHRLPDGLGNRFSAGFVNATLRRFERERDRLFEAADRDPEARHGHPAWWIERVRAACPDDWAGVLARSLTHAPLTMRVNRRRGSVAEASARLSVAGIAHRRVGEEALVLDDALPVERIPGVADGALTVQDVGAQLAAQILRPAAGERILDACAAPGGKTTHLLQRADCAVLALDVDARRIGRIGENLAREGLPQQPDWPPAGWGACVRVADAADPSAWWDGQPFDRILLDAPCSASGIVRRHPDVPWHRQRRDLATFAERQRVLLEALWPLLKPGGTLLYVTCSIFPEEGEGVISAFCSQRADLVRQAVTASWSDGQQGVAQLLPSDTAAREHDGFFYALLSKQP